MSFESHRGFTIVEAALCVVIVGVLLVASTAVFGTIARNRASQTESRLGVMLAQQLMAEILQQKFQQAGTTPPFGPQGGQSRTTFDAVDCYDGYAASPPVTSGGAAMSEYAGWSQRAAVAFADPANPASADASSTLKKITVTVAAPSGRAYTLVAWRSKFGAYEVLPPQFTTYVTGVGVTLQAASPAKSVYAGAHPLNITTSQ